MGETTELNLDETIKALKGCIDQISYAFSADLMRIRHLGSLDPQGEKYCHVTTRMEIGDCIDRIVGDLYDLHEALCDGLVACYKSGRAAEELSAVAAQASLQKIEALRRKNYDLQSRIGRLEAHIERRVTEHNPSLPEVREKVLGLTGGQCAYCGTPLNRREDDGPTFVVEHVVPKSVGGPDHFCNYVPACPSCNSAKRTAHVIEFIKRKVGSAA